MNTDDILIESSEEADQVFLNPETIYLWDEIITGSYGLRDDGPKKQMKAGPPNIARALHKIDKTQPVL
jgi:hypothetical protein